MNKTLILRIISIILLIATAVAIFAFSAQPSYKSRKTSGGLIRKICETFYPGFKQLRYKRQLEIIVALQRPIRKAAHMTIFGVLAIFAFLSAISFVRIPLYLRLSIGYAFCVIYAASDEIHQHFVPGRAARFSDVIVDMIGITATTTFMLYVFKKTENKKQKMQVNGRIKNER